MTTSIHWQTVIGLEVHAQLHTHSKLFSSSATDYVTAPNSKANFIDAGLPGVLPVLNQQAVYMAIQFGLAIGAEINDFSFFERKNYFYPDLPKGYQISQFQRPIIGRGQLKIMLDQNHSKSIDIERAHLEEDAGKSTHDIAHKYTGIDLNRAGTPLLEIITTPCIFSSVEAICYLKTLRQLLLFLKICDGNMQEGSFRCDVNISLRPLGSDILGTRVELKNLNSFRNIEKAINYERIRQIKILENNLPIALETRLYCPTTNSTKFLRTKENNSDYRYFPDPDLMPIHLSAYNLEQIHTKLPELPKAIKLRLKELDELSASDIDFLLQSPEAVKFYDELKNQSKASAKIIINWLKGIYTATLNDLGLDFSSPPISANMLAPLLNSLSNKSLSTNAAKTIFHILIKNPALSVFKLIADACIKSHDSDDSLIEIINTILKSHPQQVADYRAGKEKLLSFFIGLVMAQTKGTADPAQINLALHQALQV